MENPENLINLELLRMARDLIINEYTDKRAQAHNVWLTESEKVWNARKMKLPYPTIPPYPTEVEIVARAKTFIDFVSASKPSLDLPETDVVKEEVPKDPEQSQEPDNEVEEAIEPVIDSGVINYARNRVTEYSEENSTSSGRLLPSVLKRIGEMKQTWNN